jgi:hypothetical protein
MLKIELFDAVKLKDGREASIVEVLSATDFIADVGSGPSDWETISLNIDEISHKIDDSVN